MIKKALIHLAGPAAAVALLAGIGCDSTTGPPPGNSDTVTVVFRDGAEPLPSYTGTRDAVIRDGPSVAMRTRNEGSSPLDTLGNVSIGESLYERRLLLRFDLTSITDCGTVTGALLTISVAPGAVSYTHLTLPTNREV